MDDVRDIKALCLGNPENFLWCSTTSEMQEVRNIFYSIKKLQYADKPDYDYIRNQLNSLLQKEKMKNSLTYLETRESIGVLFLYNIT